MRRMPIKMGKYTIKSSNTKNNHHEKHLLRDSCLDESNDSGLGPDFNSSLPESNSSSCFEESDVDSSSDSVDSGISCRNRRLLAKSRSSLVANTGNSPNVYSPYMMHIETSLSTSLNHKMHIHKTNSDARSVHGHNEPPSKRRKVLPVIAPHDEKPRRSTVHHYPSASSATSGVLTEASLCVNSNIRNAYDEPLLLDLPRDVMMKGSQEYLSRGGDHIAALLSPNSHTLSRKRSNKKPSLHQPFPVCSKDGKIEMRILVQPEEQHRARYMTEGSRGSIKDEKGTGFPTVKLIGYNQPAVLQIFIGCDQGKVQPHLFYQACKVTGKNCTPCVERVIDGTYVIEIQLDPANDMTVSCDCIGILKERNVDVEQRLPYFGMTRCKKRSTKCRMVFRVNIPLANGNYETLQITSSPILCTQSPGLPEICRKSLIECPAKGGADLFIIGKNFQKDARIIFTEYSKEHSSRGTVVWEESVEPEKEYMHQSHLVCSIPPYCNQDIEKSVEVVMTVSSGGKSSEPHFFNYNPNKKVHKEDYERINYDLPPRIHSVPVVIKQEWNSDTSTSPESTCTSMSEMMSDVSSIMQPVIGNPIENSNDHSSRASLIGLNMPQLQHMVDSTAVNSLMNQCSNLLNMPLPPVEEQPPYTLVSHKDQPKVDVPDVNSLVMNQCTTLLNNMPMPHVEEQQSSFTLAPHKESSKVVEDVHHDDLISEINQLATAFVNEQQQQQQQTLHNNETVHMMAELQCNSNSNLNVLRQPSYVQESCFTANCNTIKSEMMAMTAPYCPTNSTEGIFVPVTSSATSSMCSAPLEINNDTKVVNNLYNGISDDINSKALNNFLMTTEAGQSVTNSVSDITLSNMSAVEYGPIPNPTLMLPTNKLSGVMGSCPNIAMAVATAAMAESERVQENRINGEQNSHQVLIKSEKMDFRPQESSSIPVDDTSVTFALTAMSDNDLLKMINTKDFQRTFSIC